MRPKRLQFEWNLIVLVTTALVLFGLVMVYSATSGSAVLGTETRRGYVERQALFSLLGLVAALRALAAPAGEAPRACADPSRRRRRPLRRRARGRAPLNGARRWVDVGPLAFQPSEFAKLALVVWVAAYLSRRPRRAPSGSSEARGPSSGSSPASCSSSPTSGRRS